MENFSTPMMKQYERIKKEYMDCLLFYRMGDFYELFLEDAQIGARVLDITLTSRPKGRDGRIPMAGVPYHAVDPYLSKLVKAGYKVAICEQVSEPDKYGIVDRKVIRIVTPGTVLDEHALNQKENNFITAVDFDDSYVAIAYADISTGEFHAQQYKITNLYQQLIDELASINPSECILPEKLYNNPVLLKKLSSLKNCNIFCFSHWRTDVKRSEKFLVSYFRIKTLMTFGLDTSPYAITTATALLDYLIYTQRDHLHHFTSLSPINKSKYLSIDRTTMINLELFNTIRDHDKHGSLINVIDQTITPMGGRMLRDWLKKPLKEKSLIEQRYDAVDTFLKNSLKSKELRIKLHSVGDVERILSRLSVGIGNARDMIVLKNSLKKIVEIKTDLLRFDTKIIKHIHSSISQDVIKIINYIETYIDEEPGFNVKNGNIIKDGAHKELDYLRGHIGGNKKWIEELEIKEKERTGINSLKIRFNKVFGFYIEISKANLSLAPKEYMRRQTLVNAERFITKELKEKEELILNAEEKINAIEYKLFQKVLDMILSFTTILQRSAHAIGILDCLLNFSLLAEKKNYIRPIIESSNNIDIINGRHPVVEELLDDMEFVPNNVSLSPKEQLLLITGPNMAGKSVYIRQIALLIILAQMGCFVPAEKAELNIVDKVFVRSGASDIITSGLSTFMVEMVETAQILQNATKDSLIVMDEIGRGTSTYDGISIAWAVAEYLVTNKQKPKTLFATHYHELQNLENEYPEKIKNLHMAVEKHKEEPIFLHTILPGGASHSYGVAVGKLAGLPVEVVERAYEILKQLELRHLEHHPSETLNNSIFEELEKIDINKLTPLQGLNTLSMLKNKYEQNSQTTTTTDK